MTSRVSCCKAIFRKNVTRFAPAWGLYTLCLMLGLLLMAGGDVGFSLPGSMASCIELMPLINCGYGLVVAQLLFGDLHNSRLCYSLHSMPVKREEWFWTHTASGLAFSLGPTALMAVVSLPMLLTSGYEKAWQIAPLWLLGTNLQFVCFFGIGVLSMVCSGSRLGGGLLYAVINLAAVGVNFLYQVIYLPLLYGLMGEDSLIYDFAPLVGMMSRTYIDTDFWTKFLADGTRLYGGEFHLMPAWWYLWICAGAGAVMGLLGLMLYRRRPLESAGDTVAFRWIKPLFRIAAALGCAVGAQFVLAGMFGIGEDSLNPSLVFQLLVSLAVGWFVGEMILQRSARVFRRGSFLGLGALAAALLVSVGLTWLDPLGIESYVPRLEDIASATVGESIYASHPLTLTEEEDLEDVRFLQQRAIASQLEVGNILYQGRIYDSRGAIPTEVQEEEFQRARRYILTYTLKNGRQVRREYFAFPKEPEGQILKMYFSNLLYVTGYEDTQLLMRELQEIQVEGKVLFLSHQQRRELFQAIEADCAAGNLAQNRGFHSGYFYLDNTGYPVDSVDIYLELDRKVGDVVVYDRLYISVYPDSVNTAAWLASQGFPQELNVTVQIP